MKMVSLSKIHSIPYVTSSKGATKVGMSSIKSAVKNSTKFPVELNELKQKYFNEYSSIDKILIKLKLKKDNSEEMAVLASLGVKPRRYRNGVISVERFGTQEQSAIRDMGLDENKVFKQIFDVRKNAEFDKNANITSLENLENVSGNLYLIDSNIDNLGKLNTVGRHVYLNDKLAEKDFNNVNVFGCILR